jgi:class 3 adenylate cyclase
VFTVDLSLGGLGEFLDALRVSPRGRVLVITRAGGLVAAPDADAADPTRPLETLLPRLAAGALEPERLFVVDHGGEPLLVRSVALSAAQTPWQVLVSVPERDYTEPVDAVARRTAILGLVGLALVGAAGVAAARRLGRPLRQLAVQAGRIGRHAGGGTADLPDPHDEIEALTRTVLAASRAARDRTLARNLLGRYVDPELAERWLRERRTRLAGEAREVAVLMSDLRGFSALSERLGPEAVFELLNRYLECMTAVIVAHGGSVNAFIGDGILALFGAPTRHPDDVAHAVRCGFAMQEALVTFNREGLPDGIPGLEMGVGVHAGVVMAGSIGGRSRAAYTVVGPVVNRTARIVDLAMGGEVLLSDAALAGAGGVARVGPGRRASVKGIATPITVYPLLGVEPPAPPGPPDAAAPAEPGDPAPPPAGPAGARPALRA